MIELGKMQKLEVIRKTQIGAYLKVVETTNIGVFLDWGFRSKN